MDVRSSTEGISRLESDEQQRNWRNEKWERKAKDSLANYDPTRAHLNFEVARGGIVQPIDTSKTIAEKMAENLAARGIRNPNDNPNARRKNRIIGQFIFGGNRQRMHEIAFGSQKVDLIKGADNSSITRSKDIEVWAKDVYDFMTRRYGEENIISFYVHLDEKNPHVHCTMVPVDPATNKISWRNIFGKSLAEESANMNHLHTIFEHEVGEKWGLERGSNMAETGAKHRSTEEYKRDLVRSVEELANTVQELNRQIQRLQIKVKSFTSMIEHLQERKEDIRSQIEEIAMRFADGEKDDVKLAQKIAQLSAKLDKTNADIDMRQQMLDETTELLNSAQAKFASMLRQQENLVEVVRDKNDIVATRAERDVARACNTAMATSFAPLMDTLSSEQKELLDTTGFTDLLENSQNIMNCAMLLALNYVKQATTYAESCGGGGSPGIGWGRAKDDDDDRWWLRCVTKASEMIGSGGRRQGRRR